MSDAFRQRLLAMNWPFHQGPSGRLYLRCGGRQGEWTAVVDVGDDHIVVHSVFPQVAGPGVLSRVVDRVLRLNRSDTFGCWQLDPDEGDLMYRTSAWGSAADPAIFDRAFLANLQVMDEQFAPFEHLFDGGAAPTDSDLGPTTLQAASLLLDAPAARLAEPAAETAWWSEAH